MWYLHYNEIYKKNKSSTNLNYRYPWDRSGYKELSFIVLISNFLKNTQNFRFIILKRWRGSFGVITEAVGWNYNNLKELYNSTREDDTKAQFN